MPYLIDGSNLIGHMPSLELSDPHSKRRLVGQLVLFQAIKGTKIILVFDGPVDLDLCGDRFRTKKFTILWPEVGESADSLIERQIKKQTDLRHFYVVSSDREVQKFALANRAKILNCEEFHKLLRRALKKYKESQDMNKKDSDLSPLEVDQWLDIFGASDE